MRAALRALVALALLAVFAPAAQALEFSPWSTAVNAENVLGTSELLNTDAQDGCPIQSPDRLSLYMASTRPGGHGNIDIWVAHRDSQDAPWGAPENLPEPINSASDDFCPTPIRGGGLFFVSRRVTPGVTCGMGDIYLTRLNPGTGWETPEHLGCQADGGPNTPLDEQGPSYVKTGGPTLYFSSGIATAADIYKSERHGDGSFGPPELVTSLSSASVDIQPNVRHDGREVVFASNRTGTLGFQDIWAATRTGPNGPWSAPVNLGGAVNTMAASETRPSLSWDGATLYFGRAPGGAAPATDIFVSTRARN
jgi:WD40-like Beta Propeller Repeat